MSFVIKHIVIDTFSQEILSKKVSGYLLDEIVYDVDINELGKIEDNIRNSKTTKKITAKFIETVVENVIGNEKIKMDIENEVDILIKDYMPKETSEEKLQNMRKNTIKQITRIESGLQDGLIEDSENTYLTIFKIYNLITNMYFRIIILIVTVILILVLIVLEKSRALKSIRNVSLITTVFMIMIFILIKLMTDFIDRKFAGGWLQEINTDSLTISIILGAIISGLLFLIYKHINKTDNQLIIICFCAIKVISRRKNMNSRKYLNRNDDDDKLIVVPDSRKFSNKEIEALTEFQERFFEHEIIRENIEFNSLIPELSVSNIDISKKFYMDLGFQVRYERKEDKFCFLQLEENQIMIEEDNNNWNTGKLEYPYGRGINISMTISDVEKMYNKLKEKDIKFFLDLEVHEYRVNDKISLDKEFLVQDPDGYLLRFNN